MDLKVTKTTTVELNDKDLRELIRSCVVQRLGFPVGCEADVVLHESTDYDHNTRLSCKVIITERQNDVK